MIFGYPYFQKHLTNNNGDEENRDTTGNDGEPAMIRDFDPLTRPAKTTVASGIRCAITAFGFVHEWYPDKPTNWLIIHTVVGW